MKRQRSSEDTLTLGQNIADRCSSAVGSWKFIIIQSVILIFWIILNVSLPNSKKWDSYPFILLNLMLSFQAAYTGPVLLMAANRQSEIDRNRAIENLELVQNNYKQLAELIENINKHFHELNEKIDKNNDSK
jgi:uncharacterized membrane protein